MKLFDYLKNAQEAEENGEAVTQRYVTGELKAHKNWHEMSCSSRIKKQSTSTADILLPNNCKRIWKIHISILLILLFYEGHLLLLLWSILVCHLVNRHKNCSWSFQFSFEEMEIGTITWQKDHTSCNENKFQMPNSLTLYTQLSDSMLHL